MTDRELLELAAKAAGIELWHEDVFTTGLTRKVSKSGILRWNPLTNDGDAFRLLVVLKRLQIVSTYFYHDERRQTPATVRIDGGGKMEDLYISYPKYQDSFIQHDPCAALRRAIVLAAVEIGKEKKV